MCALARQFEERTPGFLREIRVRGSDLGIAMYGRCRGRRDIPALLRFLVSERREFLSLQAGRASRAAIALSLLGAPAVRGGCGVPPPLRGRRGGRGGGG